MNKLKVGDVVRLTDEAKMRWGNPPQSMMVITEVTEYGCLIGWQSPKSPVPLWSQHWLECVSAFEAEIFRIYQREEATDDGGG